jgi:hypothetical protein
MRLEQEKVVAGLNETGLGEEAEPDDDMDEEERQMLAEARQRLARTRRHRNHRAQQMRRAMELAAFRQLHRRRAERLVLLQLPSS